MTTDRPKKKPDFWINRTIALALKDFCNKPTGKLIEQIKIRLINQHRGLSNGKTN